MKKIIIFLYVFVLSTFFCSAQSLEQNARLKITSLNLLIADSEKIGIDALKEKMTVRTAEIFLKYANWDEANITSNATAFALVSRYKNNSTEMATLLPDFERRDVIQMLDSAISTLTKLKNGLITRKAIPNLDWSKLNHVDDQILYNNRPIFPLDFTWKPSVTELTEYYGNLDGFYMDMNKIISNTGAINSTLMNELQAKASGNLGFIFIGNKAVQTWTTTKYGASFLLPVDRYTVYDIDNPGAREMMDFLLKKTVPYIKDKKFSELGYMLCNEPHFYTTKKTNGTYDWASGEVTDYTKAKFNTWLSQKHASIAALNTLWGTSFTSFNDVTIDIPISVGLQGTAMWYDWITFNDYRVTEWYKAVKTILRTYDPAAKVHLKIMPNLWSENKRGSGIDLEALTEISEIIGNDSGTDYNPMWGSPFEWQTHYILDWRELYMGFDFMKSVSPEKLVFNSETHYLSTGRTRDLYQTPMYARATFWAAATLGLNANQVWFWPRNEDGSVNFVKAGNGYGGSNCQQPRVTNEVIATNMDLNSFGEEIAAMQRQRKPVRIFYSATSATNKPAHMDDVFEIYESLNFEGVPIGFATEKIITKQSNNIWDVVLVYKTEYVTNAELAALQNYLNNGGTVIVDAVSLKKNEYGQATAGLTQVDGRLITATSLANFKTKTLGILNTKNSMPEIEITETNNSGAKTCSWKCIKNSAGNNVLSIVNLGKTDATLTIKLKNATTGTASFDLINGIEVSSKPTLKPFDVYFVEIKDLKSSLTVVDTTKYGNDKMIVYPNPSDGPLNISFQTKQNNVELLIYDLLGNQIFKKNYFNTNFIIENLSQFSNGMYVVNLNSETGNKSFKFIKKQIFTN